MKLTHHPSGLATVAVAGLLTLLLALSLASTASAKSGYKTYMWCGGPDFPGSECGSLNLWGVGIIAKDRDPFKYRVCVATPNGNKFCDNRNGNRGGESYWNLQPKYDGDGKYRATWKVGGRFVGADTIVVISDPNHPRP